MVVPLLSLANPTFQLHTLQKKCPSRLISQPRKQAVPSQKSHIQFLFWVGARETPVHFQYNATPAVLNLRSSLFKEVTLPQSSFPFLLSSSLSFSLSIYGQRWYSTTQKEPFLSSTCLSQPDPVIPASSAQCGHTKANWC